jgi:hypothetical protein
MFPIPNSLKPGDITTAFQPVLEYTIRKVQENHEGLKLGHIGFWSVLIMLIYLEKHKYCKEGTHKHN